MPSEFRFLVRWLRRAQPPRALLVRALITGVLGSLVGVGLLAGAVGLLVASSSRPGLASVAGILIIIELLAFLRSPLRYRERISAHALGFSAVSQWRHWLVTTVGQWEFSRWRTHSTGDLLERALRDTDELQDLWLRGVIPIVSALTTMLVGDVVLGTFARGARWWFVAGIITGIQLLGVLGLLSTFRALLRADRSLRTARSAYQSNIIELSTVAPELILLHEMHYLNERASGAQQLLHDAERRLVTQRRWSSVMVLVVTLGALWTIGIVHPRGSGLSYVVATLIALSTFDTLTALRSALATGVAVSGGAERLDDLAAIQSPRPNHWPGVTTLSLESVSIREGNRLLLAPTSLSIAAKRRVAITGPSGVGKSSLLRQLADLDVVSEGTILIGGQTLHSIDESELRRHVAYVASEPGLMRGYAADVLQMGREIQRNPWRDLEMLGITASSHTKWDELSRGERQRVALVRALVSGPDVIILDEPTSGLGYDETTRVLQLLGELPATFVIATHDAQVMNWCDEVIELRDASLSSTSR